MSTAALSQYEIERKKPRPSFNHSAIQANLIVHFTPFRDKYRILSELTLDLSNWESVPDLSIYPKKPLDPKNDIPAMTEPPLCVVEIIPPTQSLNDLVAKARNYFARGVKSCWIVIPPPSKIFTSSPVPMITKFSAPPTIWWTLCWTSAFRPKKCSNSIPGQVNAVARPKLLQVSSDNLKHNLFLNKKCLKFAHRLQHLFVRRLKLHYLGRESPHTETEKNRRRPYAAAGGLT